MLRRKKSNRPISSVVSTADSVNSVSHTEPMFKLVIIGNSFVGKTSLMLRYADDVFKSKHISTIGVDFKIVNVEVDGTVVKLQIWDTAGQDRFRTISSTYYRGAHGAIIVYDVSSVDSFNKVEHWLEDMDTYKKNVYKIIVGNKNDNTDDSLNSKAVSSRDAQLLAKRLNLKLFETSAKENINVKEVFEDMARELLEKERLRRYRDSYIEDLSHTIELPKTRKKCKKKC